MTSTAVPRSTARLRRIDLRVVIGLALLLAGVLGTVAVVQRATTPVGTADGRSGWPHPPLWAVS